MGGPDLGTVDCHVRSLQDTDLLRRLNEQGFQVSRDGFLRWSKDGHQHPRNWPTFDKVYNASLVIFLDFFISALGTVGASSSPDVMEKYGASNTTVFVAFTTMYFVGQAIGGVIFPPYSESFGRKNQYLLSTLVLTIFNVIIPAVPSLAAIFVGRFLTGLVSAIPSIVAAGVLEDVFDEHTRLWLTTLWLIIANLSLSIGPIFAAYVAASAGWKWIFYISTAVSGICFVLVLFMRESRSTQLLKRALKASGSTQLRIENPDHVPNLSYLLRVVLFRPLILLSTELIVFITSIISGTAFALIYLFTAVMPDIYSAYGFSRQATSLAFIPIGIGFMCSISTRMYDHRRAAKKTLTPEDKLVGFAIAAPCFAVGLWWFAWSIPPTVMPPWIVSMLGLIPIGFGINEFDCVLVGYLTDSYTTYASSAFASLSFLRSVLSSVFPLFAHSLYNLGNNTATSILAAVATVFCVSPFILMRYGKKIRGASKLARLSVEISANEAKRREDTILVAYSTEEAEKAVRLSISFD